MNTNELLEALEPVEMRELDFGIDGEWADMDEMVIGDDHYDVTRIVKGFGLRTLLLAACARGNGAEPVFFNDGYDDFHVRGVVIVSGVVMVDTDL